MNLPDNWTTTTLGEVCDKPQYGWTSKASQTGKIKYLRTTDLSSGKVDWDTVPFCLDEPDDVEKYQVKDNDIVISRAGSVGLSYRIENPPPNSVFASYLIRMRALDVEHKYLEYFLKSGDYWNQISDVAAGIAVQNINATKLAELEMPLAPLPEQRRIVAKLDKLFAHHDKLKARLEKVPELLEQFRQAVLTQAVTGKLTEEWRKLEKSKVQNLLDEVVTKIKTNKPVYEDYLSNKRFQTNKNIDVNALAEIPINWIWSTAAELVDNDADIVYGIVQPGPKLKEGVPYVRGLDIQNGKILVDQLLKTSKEIAKKYERASLKEGDSLLGIIRNTKVALVPRELNGANITQGTARLRPSDLLNPVFLKLWLESEIAQNWLQGHYRGIDMPGLNLRDVRKLPIPLCSKNEQKEIVRRVESLFALADKIEAHYNTLKEKTDHLPQAILAKAFRGELVEHDSIQKEKAYATRQTLLTP